MNERKKALIEAITALEDESAVNYFYTLNILLLRSYNLLPKTFLDESKKVSGEEMHYE